VEGGAAALDLYGGVTCPLAPGSSPGVPASGIAVPGGASWAWSWLWSWEGPSRDPSARCQQPGWPRCPQQLDLVRSLIQVLLSANL